MRATSIRSVNILTDVTPMRHLAGFAVLLLLISAMPAVTVAADTLWQPVDEITAAAEAYLKHTMGPSDDRLEPAAGYLDPRLQLPRCNVALEPYLRPGTKLAGRTIVGVRCPGATPWKVYLPVYVAVMENVLIARNSMPRGHLVRQEDVDVARRDTSSMLGGYLSRSGDIIGHRMKRAVARGVVITPSQLQAEVLIKRGQSVTLTVRNDSIDITMSGIALMDGTANQRIRVENTGSGLVVEGLVRSEEQVEVLVN